MLISFISVSPDPPISINAFGAPLRPVITHMGFIWRVFGLQKRPTSCASILAISAGAMFSSFQQHHAVVGIAYQLFALSHARTGGGDVSVRGSACPR